MSRIDMPFSLSDIDQVFAMSDLLSNTEELIKKFKPEVDKVLVKKDFFHGHFLTEYNRQFDALIRTLIKRELTDHFPAWTPEDLLVLTDLDLLHLIAPVLFDQTSYENNITETH